MCDQGSQVRLCDGSPALRKLVEYFADRPVIDRQILWMRRFVAVRCQIQSEEPVVRVLLPDSFIQLFAEELIYRKPRHFDLLLSTERRIAEVSSGNRSVVSRNALAVVC